MLLRVRTISQGAPTKRVVEDVSEPGFIQRKVSIEESCLLPKMALPNSTRSFVVESKPPVL